MIMNFTNPTPFQRPESLYVVNEELLRETDLRGVNMIMSFTGFSDAGQVVTQISKEIKDQLSNEPVAIFDVDQLIDYRSRRPRMTFTEDRLTNYQPPSLALYRVFDSLGTPFLYLQGSEPDLQWERFSLAVMSLVERF